MPMNFRHCHQGQMEWTPDLKPSKAFCSYFFFPSSPMSSIYQLHSLIIPFAYLFALVFLFALNTVSALRDIEFAYVVDLLLFLIPNKR